MQLDLERLEAATRALRGQLYEDALYDIALKEMELEVPDFVTMARVMSKADGNPNRAVLDYPELRVIKLKAEIAAIRSTARQSRVTDFFKEISDPITNFFREVTDPHAAAIHKRKAAAAKSNSFDDEFLKDKYED
jgi:hypothetical protein